LEAPRALPQGLVDDFLKHFVHFTPLSIDRFCSVWGFIANVKEKSEAEKVRGLEAGLDPSPERGSTSIRGC
jgi:hypothetical protein